MLKLQLPEYYADPARGEETAEADINLQFRTTMVGIYILSKVCTEGV